MDLPFVGQQEQVDQLLTVLTAPPDKGGRIVLIGGEAGGGKSTLVRHAKAQLQSDRAHLNGAASIWAVGYCDGLAETPPYGPWIEAISKFPLDSSALPPPFGTATGDWQPRSVAHALMRAFAGLAAPVRIVLEDIHWADLTSIELLRSAMHAIADVPVVVLATYRTDELHRNHPLWPVIPELVRLGAERIELARLGVQDVIGWVQHLLPGEAGDKVAAIVVERTDGNPLFAKELLLEARRAGVGLLDSSAIPQTLVQTIDQRLTRLSATTQSALSVAAVIGERWEYELLAAVAGVEEDELMRSMEEAIALAVIRADGALLRFDHALVRETLLSRVLPPKLKSLHRNIAEHLASSASRPDAIRVAYHFNRANDGRAANYLLQAADRAMQQRAYLQATDLYEQALQWVEETEERYAEVMMKLGAGHLLHDPLQKQPDRTLRCLSIAASLGDDAVVAWARHFQMCMPMRVEYDKVGQEAEELVRFQSSLLENEKYQRFSRDLFGKVIGYPPSATVLARGLAWVGEVDRVRDLIRFVRATARPTGQPLMLVPEFDLALHAGEWNEAMRLVTQLLKGAEQTNHDFEMSHWRWHRLYLMLQVRPDATNEVEEAVRRCLEVHQNTLDKTGNTFPNAQSPLGYYQFILGDFPQARENLIGYLRMHPHETHHEIWAAAAELCLALGDIPGAHLMVNGNFPLDEHTDKPAGMPFAAGLYTLRARAFLVEGRITDADVALGRAEELLSKGLSQTDRPHVLLARAEWLHATGDERGAMEKAEEARSASARMQDRRRQVQALRLLGELHGANGLGQAAEFFTSGRALAERCRFAYEVALIDLAEATSMVVSVEQAALLASRALETFTRIGAEPARMRAEQWIRDHQTGAGPDGTAGHTTAVAPRFVVAGGDDEIADSAPFPDGLTQRQVEIIRLVATGMTDKEIGQKLYIVPKTVEGHLRSIFNKIGVNNRTALVAYAASRGLI